MGCGPRLGVGPPWTCGGDDDTIRRRQVREQLRWSLSKWFTTLPSVPLQ
jgi:hypothetical protein